MKIVGYMAVYNEIDYVEYAIRSVIDHVDKLIIIEGAFKETVDTGSTLSSDDGTFEVLKKLEKEYWEKICLAYVNNVPQLVHRNHVFDVMKLLGLAHEDRWLWLIDGDEVYKTEDILALKAILKQTNADVVKIDSLTFVNDFSHYVEIAFPRLFRLKAKHNYRFVAPNHLADETERKILQEENHKDLVKFFHYSYCKSPARFLAKKKERTLVHGQFKWSLNDKQMVVSPGIKLRDFKGEHPEVMLTHPRNNANWNI
jgi:hypothetical protein